MGIFTKWKERSRQRQQLRELSGVAGVFRTLEQMERSGLLAWNAKQRQLFIDSSLALLMMRDADSWQSFVQNVYLWHYYRECQAAWDNYLQKEELKAVREFSQKLPKNKTLSRQDVGRIREARRSEIAESDMEPPKVDGFEFFVVSPPDLTAESLSRVGDGSPVGQLVSVGHYDPETEQMEMALWSEVEPLLRNTK